MLGSAKERLPGIDLEGFANGFLYGWKFRDAEEVSIDVAYEKDEVT